MTAGTEMPRRPMAYTVAAMYGGAAFVGMVEGLIPGGQEFSLLPAIAATLLVPIIVLVGPRLPVLALAAFAPIGAAMIAASLATTNGPGDGAVLYVWPVLWVSYFFGPRGSALIVAWVGVVHGLALLSMPSGQASIDRWLDVMVTVGVVAAVVQMLSESNRGLLRRLKREARTDKLTDVLNRRGFDERAETELARARRDDAPVTVVAFDIDHFKRVNDEWGHDAGDQVLSRLGAVLRQEARDVDIVARVGGEEFVSLLPGSDAAGGLAYAERVRAAFSRSADLGLELPRLTVSAGVAAADAAQHVEQLLQRADMALYAAKRAGRDRTMVSGQPGATPAELGRPSAALA
jgi:diguanylate cyclase (GGDEF)-like protein